jgi:hypothetical protein
MLNFEDEATPTARMGAGMMPQSILGLQTFTPGFGAIERHARSCYR